MEQTNEARAEDKPAYSMPRKEDEAARQQIQESKNEVKPPKEPDKPKKELTEEQRQKQKKLIVYPLMFIIFAIVMWLIFAPSEKEEEQGQSGFNTDVPAPADNALVGDKQAAYEQDLFNRKQDERREQMQDLASMFGSGEEQAEEMPTFDEPEVKPKSGYGGGGSSRPKETIYASANAYRDMNRTLGNFYETPKEDPEKEVKGFNLGPIELTGESVVTLGATTLIMIGLAIFINFTKTGKAMLAVSEDRGAAELMGINVNKTISITFAVGSMLAAVAGALFVSSYGFVGPYTGALPGIKAFVAAVLGGIGSIPGAMLGGILLGIIESFSKAYISTQLSDATKAFIPGNAPVYGPTNPYEDTNNAPATAASIEPTANVIDIVLFTLIPISSAAPLSSETANIALPVFVKFIKIARPIIISVVAPKVTTDSPVNSI